MPVSCNIFSDRVPITVPGMTIFGKREESIPQGLSNSLSMLLSLALRNCDVDSIVYSHTLFPVSKYDKASGINRMLRASFKALLFSWDAANI